MNNSGLSTVAHQILLPHGLTLSSESLTKLCQHWKIVKLSIFGSILRKDFNADSDGVASAFLNKDFQRKMKLV